MADLSKYKHPRRSSQQTSAGGPALPQEPLLRTFVEGALGNSFGRPVNVQYADSISKTAHEKGREAALNTYGLLGDH